MDSLQEWMFKMEDWLKGVRGDFRSAKTTVLDESAAIVARLDRIEQKVDDILTELRRMKHS